MNADEAKKLREESEASKLHAAQRPATRAISRIDADIQIIARRGGDSVSYSIRDIRGVAGIRPDLVTGLPLVDPLFVKRLLREHYVSQGFSVPPDGRHGTLHICW